MEINNKQKLINIIEEFSKMITLTSEQKNHLLENYLSMQEKDIIKDLAMKAYQYFPSDSKEFDEALYIIRNYNKDICPSIEEMKSILHKMFYNEQEGNMSIKDNHKLIISSLIDICNMLNQYEVDYYIVGALPCYLKTNQELFRYHDDIDIMINENDIPIVNGIMEFLDYNFFDDRYPSKKRFLELQEKKNPHTVIAYNPNNEFHIGFFCFKRKKDDSITIREYSSRLENEEVVVDVKERISNKERASLLYDDTPFKFHGTDIKTCSLENVYLLKSYTNRPKDIIDSKKLEPFIDFNKLNYLKDNKVQEVLIQNINYPEQTKKIR